MSMEGFFLKQRNIAKVVAGASLLIAASGEVQNAQGCEERSKTTVGQTSGLDFFETTKPKQSAPGTRFVVDGKKNTEINNDAAPVVKTTNMNGENDNNSAEVGINDRIKEDEHGNVRTLSIGEKN